MKNLIRNLVNLKALEVFITDIEPKEEDYQNQKSLCEEIPHDNAKRPSLKDSGEESVVDCSKENNIPPSEEPTIEKSSK